MRKDYIEKNFIEIDYIKKDYMGRAKKILHKKGLYK